MDNMTVGFIGFFLLIFLLFLRMPIAVAMGAIGVLGMSYLIDLEAALTLLKTVPYGTIANYGFSVVPLFILMGNFCFHAGVSKDLYNTVNKWMGQLRGGVAMATVGACAGFAAVSGSSMATAATMGTVALPEMKKLKYDPALATGAISAGGTIGILIPPSIILVIYGIMTETSIGELFIAGFIPGILEAVFYMITIYILCTIDPSMGPAGPRTTFREKVVSLKDTWMTLVLFLIVIGGIYLGVFSPSEAAGVGATGALILALLRRRMTWKGFSESLIDTLKTAAMIFTILVGAMIFGSFIAVTRLPFDLAEVVSELALNRYIIFSIIMLVYIVLGCMMVPMAIIVLTIPIIFPLIVDMGFHPVWFGIMTVRIVEIAQITPPVGMNV
ncbi:MAG: TRAP transporter large permease subunit, partial [Pseudomonadota bacterium]